MRQVFLYTLIALMLLVTGCTQSAVSTPAQSQPDKSAAPLTQSQPTHPQVDFSAVSRRVEQVGDYFKNQPEGGFGPSWIGVDEDNQMIAGGDPMLGNDGIYSNARDWFKQPDIQMMIVQRGKGIFDAPASVVPKRLYVVSRPSYQAWPASGASGALDLLANEVSLFSAGSETRTTAIQNWVKQRTGGRLSSIQRESDSIIITLNPGQLSETERMEEAVHIAAYVLLLADGDGPVVRYTGVSRMKSLDAANYDMAAWFSAGAKVDQVPQFFRIDGNSRQRSPNSPIPFGGAASPASLSSLLEQRAKWKQYFPADAKLTIGLYVNDHREAVMLVEAPVAQSGSLEAAVADYQHAAEKLLEKAPGLATVQLLLRQGDQLAFQSVEWTDLQMAKLVGAQLSPDRMKPMGPIPTLFRVAKSQ